MTGVSARSTGFPYFVSHIPMQSASPRLGSQLSLGSSTQVPPSVHGLPAIPPHACIHQGDRWKFLLRLRYRSWDKSCRRNRKRVEICPGIFGVWACRYLVHPPLCTARRRNRSTVVRQDTASPGFRHRLMAGWVQWVYRRRSIQQCRKFLRGDVWNAVAG